MFLRLSSLGIDLLRHSEKDISGQLPDINNIDTED
jgi:hypothetical protein